MMTTVQNPTKRIDRRFVLAAILVLVGLAAFLGYRTLSARAAAAPHPTRTISRQELAGQYGLQVNLVAVTAGSGMLDVRLKVLDAAKARQLLAEPEDYPVFLVGRQIIKAPADSQQSLENLTDGSMLFILAPNSRKAVQPETPVTIVIGETQIEPIKAQ